MKLAEHPTVRRFHERNGIHHEPAEPKKLLGHLSQTELKELIGLLEKVRAQWAELD